jgi:hypothetical protein
MREGRPTRSLIELGENLTDDLRRLVRRERLTAFGLGYFGGKVLDRVHAAHEHVAQCFTARFWIADLLDRRCDRMIG